MQKFYSKRKLWGTHRVYKETLKFDKIIGDVFNEAKKSEGLNPKMAIFAYGSPGRFELTGGDSDADIFIAESSITPERNQLKKVLNNRWNSFDFSKVDIPPWSTYEDIDIFLNTSLVEGNQVLETRFICGDNKIGKIIENKKIKFDSPHRELINIIFNRLYFDQYFQQRIRNGAKNIKYCNGGTRDFLVFYWYDRLCRKINGEDISLSGLTQPKIKEGLERLMMEGSISGEHYGKAIEAVNGLIELRTDALIVNRATNERGLSILDDELISRLQRTFAYPGKDKIKEYFNDITATIDKAVRVMWKKTLERGSEFYGKKWGENIDLACQANTPSKIRLAIPDEDTATRVALLWGTTASSDKKSFELLSKRYQKTTEWGTLASIACSPLCSPQILEEVATGIAKERGYGYILRIIARNKNVNETTLKAIAEDTRLAERYTCIAKAALQNGNLFANNQI